MRRVIGWVALAIALGIPFVILMIFVVIGVNVLLGPTWAALFFAACIGIAALVAWGFGGDE